MKLMIASDIHGSALYCGQLLESYQKEGADRLLLLGDILYHGPRNALPGEYAPKVVAAMLNAMKEDILCVRGNCEAEVDQMMLAFPVMADYALIALEGATLFATHGHLFNQDKQPPMKPGDILVSGHTHVPKWACQDGRYFLNPGSVSIPKEGSAHGYMIVDQGTFYWKDLTGKIFHTLTM